MATPRATPAKAGRSSTGCQFGILVYRLNALIYANRAFLDWTGYGTLEALAEAGGLDKPVHRNQRRDAQAGNGAKTLTITTVNGHQRPVEGRLFSVA